MRHLWIVLPIYCGLSLQQTNSSKQLLKQSKSVFLMVCTLYYSFWILASRLHLNVSKARQIKSKNNLLKKSEIEWDEKSKLKSWMVFAFEPFTVHFTWKIVLITKFSCKMGGFWPMGLKDGIFQVWSTPEPLVTFLGLKNYSSP